jgi:hypothetical protein
MTMSSAEALMAAIDDPAKNMTYVLKAMGIAKLKAKAGPHLAKHELDWDAHIMPLLEKVDTVDELREAAADPHGFLSQLLVSSECDQAKQGAITALAGELLRRATPGVEASAPAPQISNAGVSLFHEEPALSRNAFVHEDPGPSAQKAAAGMALLRATKAAEASLQQKKAAKSAADLAQNAEESPANERPSFKAKSTPSALLVKTGTRFVI